MSVVVRGLPDLLPLRAGLAVADLAGDAAGVKWPNDVLLDGRKLAGVLVEGRPQEQWAVIGIGVNVALDPAELPPEVRDRAATLARSPSAIEPALAELLGHLERRLAEPTEATLDALRGRDVLAGRPVAWGPPPTQRGTAAGIDDTGALRVRLDDGTEVGLDAGEVHLLPDG
jgi:BirA family biotin operon repressor/biotin-[acetyl-CoA-carboxylase] ligase